MSLDSLRSAIGLVPQDTILFNESIFHNIHYGRLDATEEEVHQAARLVGLHSLIQSLPEGYDTPLGERGLKLSGGERQRIAIARCILKGTPILIFDEATSGLDTETETLILVKLRELSRGKTTISIAHRLLTVADADHILVFDQGHIVEQGTHKDLLSKRGHYAALWDAQMGGHRKSSPSHTRMKLVKNT